MAGLQITITDAGRAALPNGPNTGTSAVTLSHVGVSPVHTAGSLKGLTSLPGEVKRVSTFGGDIVADDVIHVTINDETTAVYTVRAFGLYLSTGVLFAVFSSPDVVVEKSAGAMVLLSADITFKTLDTAVIQFGGTGFINPPATTERMGVVELASWDEAAAGARADVAVTPFGLLKTLQSWASNFASAVHRHVIASIDGLPEALAAKANHANPSFTGPMRIQGPSVEMPGSGSFIGLNLFYDGGWRRRDADHGWAIRHSGGQLIVMYGANGGSGERIEPSEVFKIDGANGRAILSGGNIWTSATFNPADKAPAIHSHDWSQITGKSDVLLKSATGLGLTGFGPLNRLSDPGQYSALPTGWSSMMAPDSHGLPGGYGYLQKAGRRDNGEGWAGLFTSHAAAPGDRASLWFGSTPDASAMPAWCRVWSDANFNPDDKAAALHSHSIAQIGGLEAALASRAKIAPDTPATGLLGWASEKLSFTGDGQSWRDVWHSGNFNPAEKAPAAHSHDWAQVTGKGDVVLKSATGLGVTGAGQVAVLNSAQDYGQLPTGWTSMVHPESYGLPGGYGYLSKLGRRDSSNGWSGLFMSHAAGPGEQASLWFGSTGDGSLMPAWSRAWSDANFNPATKATLGETVSFADVSAVRGNGTGVFYLGDTSHYLYFDGVNYSLPSAPLLVNGAFVWTAATFDPASKADAQHSHDWGQITGKPGWASETQVTDAATAPTIHDQMLSPAALWAFARNLGNPAYAVIPGTGLMIQCGVVTGNIAEGQAHATLPVAFGGGCIAAVAIPQNAGSNLASNFFMQIVSKNLDRLVFYANRSDSSSGNINGFDWVAIGRVSGTPDPAYSSGGSGGIGGGGGGGGGGGPEIEV